MANPVKTFHDHDYLNTNRPKNVPPSTAAGEVVVHEQLQSALEGLKTKDPTRVRTASNISIASPGATLDGVTMVAGDRVLVSGQTAASENGIYVWNGAGVAMTRSLDANSSSELTGAVVDVLEGTSSETKWRQTAVNPTIGTTSIVWDSFGSSTPVASTTVSGTVELATQAEVDAGTVGVFAVTPETLVAWSGRSKKFVTNFGDGSATQYDLPHNLNTLDVEVELVEVSSGQTVAALVTRTSVNIVRINATPAPASNALRAIIRS
jgi:hypothetical protein